MTLPPLSSVQDDPEHDAPWLVELTLTLPPAVGLAAPVTVTWAPNVAPALSSLETLVSVQVKPVCPAQAPVQPLKLYPRFDVAASATSPPLPSVQDDPEHDAPWLDELALTLPPAVGLADPLTVMRLGCWPLRAKPAVALASFVMWLSVQVEPVCPAQAPVQPLKL